VVVVVGSVDAVVELGSEVVEALVLVLVVVELVGVVVVVGGGPPATWTTRAIKRMVIPTPPRIGHRRGRARLGSGPPTTEKSYGTRDC
jgi:hypothetical protein